MLPPLGKRTDLRSSARQEDHHHHPPSRPGHVEAKQLRRRDGPWLRSAKRGRQMIIRRHLSQDKTRPSSSSAAVNDRRSFDRLRFEHWKLGKSTFNASHMLRHASFHPPQRRRTLSAYSTRFASRRPQAYWSGWYKDSLMYFASSMLRSDLSTETICEILYQPLRYACRLLLANLVLRNTTACWR